MAELNARYGTALRALRGRAEVGSYPAHPACLRGNQSGRKDAHVSGLHPSLRLPRAVHSDLQDARVGEDGPATHRVDRRVALRVSAVVHGGEASVGWERPRSGSSCKAPLRVVRPRPDRSPHASRRAHRPADEHRRRPVQAFVGQRRRHRGIRRGLALGARRRTGLASAPATDVRSWPSRRLDRLVPIAAFSAANNGVMIGR